MLSINEPPSCSSRQFLIGRDRQGHWVVRDESGLHGGLFINRSEAVRFAMRETGRDPDAIFTVPGVLELDLHAEASGEPERRAA